MLSQKWSTVSIHPSFVVFMPCAKWRMPSSSPEPLYHRVTIWSLGSVLLPIGFCQLRIAFSSEDWLFRRRFSENVSISIANQHLFIKNYFPRIFFVSVLYASTLG